MPLNINIDMQYTENPYIDVLIYNVKKLSIDTVLKLKDNADKAETLESKKNADLYIASLEGTAIFDIFPSFPEEVLRKAGLSGLTLIKAIDNPENVPKDFRDAVLKAAKEYTIANYEEMNDYYRMLEGLPPLGYEDVYVTGWTPPEDVIIDLNTPIHKMSIGAINILNRYGVLDEMYDQDPINRAYFRYLDKKIDPYAARKADMFSPLYVPTIDSTEIQNEYFTRLQINRHYALRTMYSAAFRVDSDYYDNFVSLFIVLMTMVDMISRIQEFIARKEVFDIRTVRYIFESNGITYFPEIPMKYQIKMIKNLHQLMKYKSTSKCMIDICSLFGFKNIKIFKYYLLRSRKYIKATDEYEFSGDDSEDFEMRFLKIPIDGKMQDYIRDSSNYVDYDEITSGDPTWDAERDHDTVKDNHLNMEYNYTRTKYLSVDSLYDIAKVSIQQSYFFNMLYDNLPLETQINLNIPFIGSKQFNICDIFTFLTALTYQYNNMKDLIMDTEGKVQTILGSNVLGFNFKANLSEIATHLCEILGMDVNTMSLEVLSQKLELEERNAIIDTFHKFDIPTDSIPSMNQLMKLFTNNLEVHDLVVKGMRAASNKKIYDAYKLIYDSILTIQLSLDFFKDPETGDFYKDIDGDATYTAYLMHKDPILYDKLIEIELMDDQDNKIQYIANLIDNIVYILEAYIDTEEFSGIFNSLPVVSTEAVKQYIKTVIDFYKSYKVHFLGINTIYILDDKNDQWVKIIDECILNRFFTKDDIVMINERIAKMLVDMTEKDKYDIVEKIYLDITSWISWDKVDPYHIKDLPNVISHLIPIDHLVLDESYKIVSRINQDESFIPFDMHGIFNVSSTQKDEMGYHDACRIVEIPAGT